MTEPKKKPATPSRRMWTYRAKMRAAGLRPVQIWVPDTKAPGFQEACRRQASAIATSDPAGDDLLEMDRIGLRMAGMIRRGHIVVVAMQQEFGKPRLALVVQSDLFAPLPSLTVCPITSLVRNDSELLRLDVDATLESGLRLASQISVDKITTIRRDKVGGVIGQADEATMVRVNRALAVFLGLA